MIIQASVELISTPPKRFARRVGEVHNGIFLLMILVCGTAGFSATGRASLTDSAQAVSTEAGMAQVQVRTALRHRLQADDDDHAVVGLRLMRPLEVRRFYRQRSFQSAWLDAYGRPKPVAGQLAAALADAASHGLRPADYRAAAVQIVVQRLGVNGAARVAELVDFELLLSGTFFAYAGDLAGARAALAAHRSDLQPPPFDAPAALRQALFRGAVGAALERLAPADSGYQSLRRALAEMRVTAARGGWPSLPAGRKLEPGTIDPRVVLLRRRLTASGDYAGRQLASIDPNRYDPQLAAAVRRFQTRHGLPADAVVAKRTLAALNRTAAERVTQLELNLERLRWLPRQRGWRHIVVNIPDYSLRLVENGETVLTSRAVVGRADRQTPVLAADMTHLVLSPYWYLPPTIALEDKLPQLRENPHALRDDNIRVLADGGEIDPGTVDWRAVDKRDFRYVLRQDPGPGNALGGVKFMFPNRHSVYLHDTPSRRLFERPRRAYSSGCVRIEQPYQLASQLLDGALDPQTLRYQGRAGRERRVDLPTPVPVYLLYQTAWVDGQGELHFRRDLYRHDRHLARQLNGG